MRPWLLTGTPEGATDSIEADLRDPTRSSGTPDPGAEWLDRDVPSYAGIGRKP
jgi:hypothetical protein